MAFPSQQPDLMITESTYGNRLHSNRRQEEERLVQAVAQVVAAGGKVLIPSFALGRAQEVILILLDAIRRGQLPKAPLYVDGMVKTMCAVYHQFPEFLNEALRRQISKEGNPFFYPGGAQAVTFKQRQALVKDKGPAIIVASSGMLTGGASRYYAEHLVTDDKNAIFITGYQDEESPGRQLLDLAAEVQEKGEGLLRLDGVTRRVLCRVERYGLSAHADASQLISVVCRMKPKHILLVHGDDEARAALAQGFPADMTVHRPDNRQTLEFPAFRSPSKFRQTVSAGLAAPGEALNLQRLHAVLLSRNGPSRAFHTAPNSPGYQVSVRTYADPRLAQLLRSKVEDELLQAIYRIRPLSVAGDRHQLDLFEDGQRTQAMIYIFSSRPLPDVPVALSIAPKTERQVIDFHSAAQAIHLRRQAVTEQRLAEELRTTHNQVRRWKAALTPVALGSPALPLPPPPTPVFI